MNHPQKNFLLHIWFIHHWHSSVLKRIVLSECGWWLKFAERNSIQQIKIIEDAIFPIIIRSFWTN